MYRRCAVLLLFLLAAIGGQAQSSITAAVMAEVEVEEVFFQRVRDLTGATLVMGGLTREEIKTVHDKVPFSGDIRGLGQLFRSEGETTQKRNLLIFVTANLVSPGGSPKKQELPNVAPSSAFQNPSLVTPGGAVERE